jgi:uncharacterized protein YuzE
MTVKELKEILDGVDEDIEIMIEQGDDVIEIEDWQYKDVLKTLFFEIEEV